MKRAAGRAIKIAIELLAVLLVIGLFLPTNFVVLRTTSIAAPTETIYPLVNDLTQWQRWEPWSEMDPSIKISRGDITQGVGATQSWVGNDGSGSLRITHSSPETGIAYDLSFDSGRHSCES
ncbi:MAG: hypothetical protein KDD44_11985, partial [Bdellovibrionales bacterium]|nr:hypothetical protein [Bdellovibrionales bacterium]